MKRLHQTNDIIANRYRIVKVLGEGGSGTTYEAEDLVNYHCVAIKVVFLSEVEDWKVLELLEREAKVLANLTHQRIPKYKDYFYLDSQSDRHFYLVQELVTGKSLGEWIEDGWHPTEAEVKDIAVQILSILTYLQQLNPAVIHRDLKPQNLIRNQAGEIYLVDFGSVQDVYRRTLTRNATFVGTFGYMPPEQLLAKTYLASDLYSLGASLIFLLTRTHPADLPQKRMKIDFRSLVNINSHFADWLEKMLEPAIEDRYHSATEALQVLQRQPKIPAFKGQTQFLATLPQPQGSKIWLRKTPTKLVAKLMPIRWQDKTINAGLLAALSILLGVGFTSIFLEFLAFAGIDLTWFIIILLFGTGLAAFLPLAKLIWCLWGKTTLKIEKDRFCLTMRCWGVSWHRFGKTSDITKIEATSDRDERGKKSLYCLLWHGVKPYKFGSNLTPIEQDWLVGEILDFLELIRFPPQ